MKFKEKERQALSLEKTGIVTLEATPGETEMKITIKTLTLVLICFLTSGSGSYAQQSSNQLLIAPLAPGPATVKPPVSAELAQITERGKALYLYDKACSEATDALLAKKTSSASFKLFVAYPEHDLWHVAFGSLSDDEQGFLVAYEATFKPGSDIEIKSYDIFKLDTGEYLKRAKVLVACKSKMKSTGPQMNYAALPNDRDTYWVYQFPGTTEPGVYLLGGDVRYLVSSKDGKILETRQLHTSVLSWPKRGQLPDGAQLQGGCHSAILSDLPEDTDVFHVLLRKPQLPEYIATANWIYCVETDGTIRIVSTMKKD